MRLRALFCILSLGAVLPGCVLLPWVKKKPKTAAPPRPIAVGTVSLVNVEAKFALVDNGALPVPPVGGVLRCYAGTASEPNAEMVATDVRRRPFTIADIHEGAPHKGDRVIYVPPELLKTLKAAPANGPVGSAPAQVSTAGPGVQ